MDQKNSEKLLSLFHQEIFGAKVSSQLLPALYILPNLNIGRKRTYFYIMTFPFLAKTNLFVFYKNDWKINTLQVKLVSLK